MMTSESTVLGSRVSSVRSLIVQLKHVIGTRCAKKVPQRAAFSSHQPCIKNSYRNFVYKSSVPEQAKGGAARIDGSDYQSRTGTL